MKMSLVLAAAAAAAAFAAPASAQDASGNYVQINLGANVSGQVDLEATLPPDTFTTDADLETGLFASVVGGLNAGGGFALEGEVMHFSSDIDTAEADAALGYALDASVASTAVMINGVYTFGAGSFSPYVGAGAGWGTSEYEFAGASDDDGGIAWQIKAGVTFPMSDTMTWDLGYRYLSLPSYEKSEGGVSVDADGTGHVVTLGARFAF